MQIQQISNINVQQKEVNMKFIKVLFLFLVSIIFLQSNVLAGPTPTYNVTATATGTGSGTVMSALYVNTVVTTTSIDSNEIVVLNETVSNDGINYTYPGTDTGTTTIEHDRRVVLTARANSGSTVSWTTCAGGTVGGNATVATCTYPVQVVGQANNYSRYSAIDGQVANVTETATFTADPPPPPPPCSLSISPYNPSVTGDAGTTTYGVSNAVGYTNVSWTASVWQGGDWFTITSGASGTDAGTITCSFTANPSTAIARTAYIGIVPSDGLCQGHLGIMVTQNPLSASATLLWTNTDGTALVWSLDTPGNLMSSKTYGPFTGWTADSFHKEAVSDGTSQMLWNHINGTASVQFMNDMGDMISMEYGPETGWTAVSYHLNRDGTAQMLWNHTDGTASVWSLDVRGDVTSRILYGPYTDSIGAWIAADYRRNSDGTANMLWVRTDAYTRLSSF
jgi:hypothetical protein